MERTAADESSGGSEKAAVATQQPLLAAEEKQTIMKVMVAVDESDESLYALKWTLDHFFNLPSAGVAPPPEEPGRDSSMITIVHVLQPFQPIIYPAGPVYATPMLVESVRKAQEEKAAVVLNRALQMCKPYKIKAETMILVGDPKDRICEAAEELHVDLLVVGSRGLGKIKRAFLGSVSDYCAHHVHCPILIVKPPRDQEVLK